MQLKSTLYGAACKFRENRAILENISLCIAFETIQAQWPDFIEEIVKQFADSLESVAIAFRILKVKYYV